MSKRKKNKPNKRKPKGVAEKKWREFEKLVARLEAFLDPKGVKVTSPDHVTDVVTNTPREVDASLRYRIGSSEQLMTLECRDRKSVEDVLWIEQLVTKTKDIQANKCIAVSSSGFSRAAITKAKHHNVDVRIVQDVTAQDILAWFDNLYVDVEFHTFNLDGVNFALETGGGMKDIQLADDLATGFTNDSWNSPIIFDRETNKWLDVQYLLKDYLSQGGELYDPTAPWGQPFRRHIHVHSMPPGAYTRTTRGTFDLSVLDIALDITRKKERILMTDHLQYSDENKPLAYAGQGKLVIDRNNYYTFVIRRTHDNPNLPHLEFQAHGPDVTDDPKYIVTLPPAARRDQPIERNGND